MKTAIVIGNCQVQPLSFYLNYYNDEYNFVPFQVIIKEKNYIDERLKLLENDDILILTQNIISNSYNYANTEKLKEEFKNVYTITNFYFSGLFPDFKPNIYAKGKINSGLYELNSNIVLTSFINGLTEKECCLEFNEENYIKYDYFSLYNMQINELIFRNKTVDLPYAEEFIESIGSRPTLYWYTHPADFIFDSYAQKILKEFGLHNKKIFPANLYLNNFSFVTLPVYKEIAEHHKLPYETFDFLIIDNKVYSLEQYINYAYGLYKQQLGLIMTYAFEHPLLFPDSEIYSFVIKLYKAILRRFPEYEGLMLYKNYIKDREFNIKNVHEIINYMYNSEEFRNIGQ